MISTPSATLSELSEDLQPANTTGGPADLRHLLAELVEEKTSATDSTQTTAISPTGPSSDAKIRPAVLKREQPSLGKQTVRGLVRFLMIFGMGVATALAWQSYGDATREMIASSYPQLAWLAPETVAVETTPEITSSIASATSSDSQEKTVAAETIPETTSPIAPAPNSDVTAETTPERTSPIAPGTTFNSQEIKAILMNLGAVQQSVDQLAAKQQQMANDIATLKATEQNFLRKISSAPSVRPAAAPAHKPIPVSSRSPQEPHVR
jgi:hypothetical protein